MEKKGKGWHGESRRHSEVAKKGFSKKAKARASRSQKENNDKKKLIEVQSLSDDKVKKLRNQYVKLLINTSSKSSLLTDAKVLDIKNRHKMNKEQLAKEITYYYEIQYLKELSTFTKPDLKKYYEDKIELKKLWVKHYDKETGEGTDKYIQACKEYFASKRSIQI